MAGMYFNSLVFLRALETDLRSGKKLILLSLMMGWEEWILVEWLIQALQWEPHLVITQESSGQPQSTESLIPPLYYLLEETPVLLGLWFPHPVRGLVGYLVCILWVTGLLVWAVYRDLTVSPCPFPLHFQTNWGLEYNIMYYPHRSVPKCTRLVQLCSLIFRFEKLMALEVAWACHKLGRRNWEMVWVK